jgi:hypothetical protein
MEKWFLEQAKAVTDLSGRKKPYKVLYRFTFDN